MELPKMPNKYSIKKFLKAVDQNEPEQIRSLIHDPDMLKDFDTLHRIWEEASHMNKFKSVDVESDWNAVNSKLGTRYISCIIIKFL